MPMTPWHSWGHRRKTGGQSWAEFKFCRALYISIFEECSQRDDKKHGPPLPVSTWGCWVFVAKAFPRENMTAEPTEAVCLQSAVKWPCTLICPRREGPDTCKEPGLWGHQSYRRPVRGTRTISIPKGHTTADSFLLYPQGRRIMDTVIYASIPILFLYTKMMIGL